jgi:hypothetical protein
MQLVETPIQMIKGSIRLFVFACFLDDAVRRGTITPACLQEQMRLEEGEGWGITLKKAHTGGELEHGAKNLVLITLGTTAVATNKALEAVYGNIDPTDTSQHGSARVLLYQIRCAFAHDPLNPVWAPTSNYDRHYRLTVTVNRPPSEPMTERTIEFHPTSLKNKRLNPEHFGGLGGYLGLLGYFQKTIEDHPKGNQSYLPSPEEP